MNTRQECKNQPRETTGNTFTALAACFLAAVMTFFAIGVMQGRQAQSSADLLVSNHAQGASLSHGQTNH